MVREVFNKAWKKRLTRLSLFTVTESLVIFNTSLTVSILLNGVKSVVERLTVEFVAMPSPS